MLLIPLIFALLTNQAAMREVSIPGDCVGRPCVFTSNIAFDDSGLPDDRPTTWGTTAAVRVPFHFSPPPGYRVAILHVRGDLIGWARGPVPEGTFAGILWGLQNSSSGPATTVDLAAQGCYIYHQGAVGRERERVDFDEDTRDVGLLDPDNVLWSVQALFLNDTGRTIHQEISVLVTFRFVRDGKLE